VTEIATSQPNTSNDLHELNYDIESAVLSRYQEGARQQQPSLCCPTEYEGNYTENLPAEIIAKDYGCGDPTRYVNEGETVVDLGSGAGKNCYILAQKVGKSGKIIGVDFNDEMLNLARKYQGEMADKLGYGNTV
jgi:arsenite methyltransferase